MKQEKKYYKRSNGDEILIKDMNTEHLINSLSKKYRELFESKSKSDYSKNIVAINDLKEDLYKRFNDFYETLGDNDE